MAAGFGLDSFMAELHLTFFSICRGQEHPVDAVLSADGGPAPAIVSAEKIEGQPVALRPMTPSFRKVVHQYNFFSRLLYFVGT